MTFYAEFKYKFNVTSGGLLNKKDAIKDQTPKGTGRENDWPCIPSPQSISQ